MSGSCLSSEGGQKKLTLKSLRIIFPPYQNPPKSSQKLIPEGIKVLIDFWVDIWSIWGPISAAQRGPRRAQEAAKTAKTGPRGRHDGPKGRQGGPKMVPKKKKTDCLLNISVLAAKSLQRPPWTPPRLILGHFFVIFWSIVGRFLVDFG